MSRRTVLASTVVFVLTASLCQPWQLEKDVERELAGAWAVVLVEVYSNCAGAYNNNELNAAGVTAKATRRFDAGELVRIDKINLKKDRLDLFLSLREPVLMSRIDGPFELFDEKTCKVQLMIELPRSVTTGNDPSSVLGRLDNIMVVSPSLNAAEMSSQWNRRVREAYPTSYELTLARHAVWVAEETNAAVAARTSQALRDIRYVTEGMRTDEVYLAGFAAGIEDLRDWNEDDCPDLLSANLDWIGSSTPDKSRTWKEGWEDGQALVFNLYLIEHLEYCLVPVPPSP